MRTHTLFKNTVTPLLAAALLLSAPACIGKRNGAGNPNSGVLSPNTLTPPDGSPQIQGQPTLADLKMGMGTRDFNQLNQTMASLTGVDPRNTAAVTTYNTVSPSLPGDNNLTTLAGPNIVAITRLASQYCDLATTTANATRTALFPLIDFTKTASNISVAARDGVIASLLTHFNKDATAAPEDVAVLQQLYVDLNTAGASTAGLMVSLCTAALGSVKAVVAL